MTSNNIPHEAELDRVVAEIRDEQIDEQVIRAASDRVWSSVAAELGEPADTASVALPLRSCQDFQALIPAYVAGTLPEARALLVGDHARECVPCRRVLIETRGGQSNARSSQRSAATRQRSQVVRWALAAAMLIGALLVGYTTTTNLLADRRLYGHVDQVEGTLQLVSAEGVRDLAVGDRISTRQQIRTGKGSGAMIKLADGSMVEMAERSELALRGRRAGTYVNLERGNVIVHAAKQHDGNLFVATDRCLVAVKGTIFSVNHGLKGSRVSVIEGEVEVRQQGGLALLQPGDQVTTDSHLDRVAVEEEIAWSRNREEHVALLHELTKLRHDMAVAADVGGVRTSTRLLDLCPADTVIYAAIPNVVEGLSAAHQVFEKHLAASEILRTWWEDKVDRSGFEQELEELLAQLQPFAAALGDEMAAAIPAGVISDQQAGPVLLALLDDPAAFTALLQEQLDRHAGEAGQSTLVIVDDPQQAPAVPGGWLVWVEGTVLAIAQTPGELQQIAGALADATANPFYGTTLHTRLADAYANGVSWLLGMDVHEVLATAAASADNELAMLEQTGLLDAGTLVLERQSDGETSTIRAVLDFDGPRRGMAAWLANPAPMGSLQFISSQASLAAAAVTKEPADMFDDLLTMLATVTPQAVDELRDWEQEHGIDIGRDIAASLGGEAAFALDGPVLPIPAWKLVIEVYDPAGVEQTIALAVERANQELAAENLAGLTLSSEEASGLTYHTIRHDSTGFQVVYAISDGFLVAAPQRAVIDLAVQYRDSGANLATSAELRALLPSDSYTDFSALLYRDLGRLAEMLPSSVVGQLPPEMAGMVDQGSEPSLLCIYGEDDRIILTGSGGSLFGSASLAGLQGIFGELGCAS